MRFAVALLGAMITTSAFAQTSSFQLHGYLSARAIRVKSEPSWTQHGFGRFDIGAESSENSRTVNQEIAQLGFDWTPVSWLLIHADGIARREPEGTAGKRAGIVQGFVDLHSEKFRLRAGSFWLPTSRENTDPLWTSRYTLTYSALNTWIGEEVRPLGADLQFSPNFYITLGATAFRGNDTMGTVLAGRGWTFGNRLTVYDEVVALPPPDEVTKPIGRDLDSKTGYSGRIRLQLPERALLQIARVDNRAVIGRGEPPDEPWRTRFNVVSLEIGGSSPTTLAAEWSKGDTALGFPGGSFTLDFQTSYLLVSRKRGSERYTVRIDRFSRHDHTRPVVDGRRENGRAYTAAWLRDFSDHLRGGIEYSRVSDAPSSGSTITLEMRLAF